MEEDEEFARAKDRGYVARARKIAETTINGKRVVVEELISWYGDFAVEIQAREVGTQRLVAYAGLNVRHGLDEVRPDFMELRQIKVMPGFREGGFGNSFLALVDHFAAKENVPLVLEVEPTSEKPMDREKLAEWYKRHGYREFTPKEIEHYAQLESMKHIDGSLIREGFERSTGGLTGRYRHFREEIEEEDVRALAELPEAERIRMYKERLIERYGTDRAYASNLRVYREGVASHLIREPHVPVNQRLLTRFAFAKRYRFTDRHRLRTTWNAIHASGKEPRKRPEVHHRPRI